ncbi:MAG: NAD(P)H-dependent flavin oxidoreductase [Acidiferrobacterales bacterium]
MLRTQVCDLLGIEFPIIQAGMGAFASPDLVAAVSNAGGLGSFGARPELGERAADNIRERMARTRELTDRPFAVNHTVNDLNEVAFAATLETKPSLISFALGDPGDLVGRAHDAGIPVMHQVTTLRQARQAAELGVDIVVAQGGEAGGFGGTVAGLVLIPQVVDAVSPIPVIAAGGIADGRGFAAALVLGAQGINIGTRFLTSVEAAVDDAWKQAILTGESEDAIKVDFWNDIFPPTGSAYTVIPRALRSPFIDEWRNRRHEVRQEAQRLQSQVMIAKEQGKYGELTPFAGQTAGLIHEILPAAEIVHTIVAEAEEVLKRATNVLR